MVMAQQSLLLEALKTESINNIKGYQSEIQTFQRCKETFQAHPVSVAHFDLIVTMLRYKIEENYYDIEQFREWEKESCRV